MIMNFAYSAVETYCTMAVLYTYILIIDLIKSNLFKSDNNM